MELNGPARATARAESCWGYQVTTHSEAHYTPVTEPGPGPLPGAADERLLAALLDGMDVGLFALDAEGRVTHWNQGAERLLGWRRADAVGRGGLAGWAVREADAADIGARLLRAPRRTGEDRPVRNVHEFGMLRHDGSRVLVRAQATAVAGPDGEPAGVYCAFGEVHAQLDMERNLALSRALVSESCWGVVVVDADLRTVAVNDRAASGLAVAPVDMLGEPLGEFFGTGLEELESMLEDALAGRGPREPVEVWATLLDDGSHEDQLGETRGGLPGGPRRCWLSGFLRLESPLSTEPAPLGVAWVFQDVTRARTEARREARRRFRDSQLSRAARAGAECEDPLEAVSLHLEFALPGFAEHALLDLVRPGAAGGGPRLLRFAGSPGTDGGDGGVRGSGGVPVRYRPGHPALQALDREVPVRATGGVSRSDWAVQHKWPTEAEHALCVVLRSRGRSLGVVTFLRGAGRPGFDRADAAYGEDVALRLAAAVDLSGATGSAPRAR
ncbi:PAS domain-containing protein [Streptomyces sodiiphilus]